MSAPYLSQILMFGGNFAPVNYALCNGQTISISQNTALFTVLGTTYGGDGVNTFQLPNLQSCLPVSMGAGLGLSNYTIGQVGGTANVTLLQSTVPPHSHTFNVSTAAASSATVGNSLVPAAASGTSYVTAANGNLTPQQMAASALSTSGQSLPHANLMPSLCITFAIALFGVFPTRN